MANTFPAKPSLIIGLGGTGIKTATQIKKDLMEINDNQLPKGVVILGFDTEKENRVRLGGWGRARQPGARATGPVTLGAGEYVYLGKNVRPYAERVRDDEDPWVGYWWQAREMLAQNVPANVWNLNEGAGQYRQMGRIAVFQSLVTFKKLVTDAMQTIRSQTNGSEVTIHIIGSTVGGTGAGMFADAAYLARQFAHQVQLKQTKVYGYLALVEAFEGTSQVNLGDHLRRKQFEARGYAALRELARLQTAITDGVGYPIKYSESSDEALNGRLGGALFDMTYLFDGRREANPLSQVLIEHGIAPTVADVVVAQVDAVGGTDVSAHIANIPTARDAAGVDTGVALVGAVGSYSVVLPIYHWVEGWAHQLAVEVLETLFPAQTKHAETKVPASLRSDMRGGVPGQDGEIEAINELKAAKDGFTEFVAYIWGVGRRYADEGQRVEVRRELDNLSAEELVRKMDPDIMSTQADQAKKRVMRRLQADLTKKEVVRGEPNDYYVDAAGSGGDERAKATWVRDEVRRQMNRLVGKEQNDGRREGGDFKDALDGYKTLHVKRFVQVLRGRLQTLLNGALSDPAKTARAGKLGFVLAMVRAIRNHFNTAVVPFEGLQGATSSKNATPALWFATDQKSLNEVNRELEDNPNGGRRKAYVEAAQRVLEKHMVDIARRLAKDTAQELVYQLDGLIASLEDCQNALALRNEAQNGVWALVLRGQNDNQADRDQATQVVTRWVIKDTVYETKKYQLYSQKNGAFENLLKSFEWEVVEGEKGLRAVLKLENKPLDLQSGIGVENTHRLLSRCRAVFEPAWQDLSVMSYLVETYHPSEKFPQLVDKLKKSNGPLLEMTGRAGFALPANFLRVHDQSRDDAEQNFGQPNFTNTLLLQLAAELNLATANQNIEDLKRQSLVGESHSQDRFKLTFLFYRDGNVLADTASFDHQARSYRSWDQNLSFLHIFAAEQNAVRYERRVGTYLHQRVREFDPRVVMLLEDLEVFKLAARCLVYGDAQRDWGGKQRGILFYRYMPPEQNPNRYRQYRLTAIPGGKDVVETTDAQGQHVLIDKISRKPAAPAHWELSGLTDTPSLFEAFNQFIYLGHAKGNTSRRFDEQGHKRLLDTLEWAINQDREARMQAGHLYWAAPANLKGEKLILAQNQAATYAKLTTWLETRGKPALEAFREEVHPSGAQRDGTRRDAAAVGKQREADLWTALCLVVEEEARRLYDTLEEYGGIFSPIPDTELRPVVDEPPSQPLPTVPTDVVEHTPVDPVEPHGSKPVCVTKGCANENKEVTGKFCPECGKPPQLPGATTKPMCITEGCANYGKEVAGKFCPECGKPPQLPRATTKPMCITEGCANYGKEVAGKFCPECGKPPQVPSAATKPTCQTQGCVNYGKEVAGKFCPECGKPPQVLNTANKPTCQTASCTNYGKGVTGKFCPECGQPPQVLSMANKPTCQTEGCANYGKEVVGKFCPECGKPPQIPGAVAKPVCVTNNCVNKGKEVSGKFCPECGQAPQILVAQ